MPVDHAMSTPNRFLLLVGGDERRTGAGALERSADVVVAVDSGLHLALALGLPVDHVVGDMDSVDPSAVAAAEAAGALIHVHPADKDATDLELALELVLSLQRGSTAGTGPTPSTSPSGVVPALHVIGGGGGRLDHLIGDLFMLSGPRLRWWHVSARFGEAAVSVAWPGSTREVRGVPGEQVSLLPIHGAATGVTTSGLRWPLVDGHLVAGTSRGISNEFEGSVAMVTVETGTVVVLQPGTRGDVAEPRRGPYDPTPKPAPPTSPAHANPTVTNEESSHDR